MKIKTLIKTGALVLVATTLLSCGGKESGTDDNKPQKPERTEKISMWVGQESVEFYNKVSKEYLNAHPEFKYDISIVAADTGTAASSLLKDNTACADIVTVAHDNIGKLSSKNMILPIVEPNLLEQISNDNPDSFKKVIQNTYGADGKEYTFAVPYISQALFLYYNKQYVSAEDALTFEGLEKAAAKVDKKAFTVTGTDCYNFSFTGLAVREVDKHTSVKIYDDFKMKNCFFQGNDTIAVTRWAQEEFAKKNGGKMPSSSGWVVDFNKDTANVCSVIGGAWHFNAAKAAVGEENLGCALIPTFTLKENHVAGLTANSFDSNVPQAGDVYRGGTFADCKCFVINTASKVEKTKSIYELLSYLSSKDIQNRSFIEAGNVPAHKEAVSYIEAHKNELPVTTYEMAKAQTGMALYGRPQPFLTGILNTYFYSKGTDSILFNTIIDEKNQFKTVDSIRKQLYKIEHTWTKGSAPADDKIPTELPAAMPVKK